MNKKRRRKGSKLCTVWTDKRKIEDLHLHMIYNWEKICILNLYSLAFKKKNHKSSWSHWNNVAQTTLPSPTSSLAFKRKDWNFFLHHIFYTSSTAQSSKAPNSLHVQNPTNPRQPNKFNPTTMKHTKTELQSPQDSQLLRQTAKRKWIEAKSIRLTGGGRRSGGVESEKVGRKTLAFSVACTFALVGRGKAAAY